MQSASGMMVSPAQLPNPVLVTPLTDKADHTEWHIFQLLAGNSLIPEVENAEQSCDDQQILSSFFPFFPLRILMRGMICALASVAFLSFAGCGSGQVPVYAVKGKLMQGGVPLGDVHLVLSPVESNIPFASADVKPDGTFELKSSDGRPGAAKGSFKVVLAAAATSTDPMAKMLEMRDQMQKKGGKMDASKLKSLEVFPAAYRDLSTSPKTIEIKGEDLNLEISI